MALSGTRTASRNGRPSASSGSARPAYASSSPSASGRRKARGAKAATASTTCSKGAFVSTISPAPSNSTPGSNPRVLAGGHSSPVGSGPSMVIDRTAMPSPG